MIPAGPLFHKPKSVLAARNIFYASLFLGILSSLVGEFSADIHNYSSVQGLLITIITFGLLFIIIRQIGLGKKWARTLYFILFIIGSLAIPFYIPLIFRASLVLGFLFILQMALQIMALVYLYSKTSNVWFNSFNTISDMV